jgi:hypothetical protein
MLRTVMSINGFYYSPTFDLSRSLQFLGENTSPEFVNRSLYDRVMSLLDILIYNIRLRIGYAGTLI